MAELLPSRRRAESFSRALEGHLQPTDQRLQRLLDTASRLSAVPLVEPREDFRSALRERLVRAAAHELPAQAAAAAGRPEPGRDHGSHGATIIDTPVAARRRRHLVAVATGLVLLGGGTGVAAASEQALPGDMLYPVKRTLESAQISLAQSPRGEGNALLERAATRLAEAESIGSEEDLNEHRVDAAESALNDFVRDAAHGGSQLLDAFFTSNDVQDLRTLRVFASRSRGTLSHLAQTLPPQSQPALLAAGETVVSLDDMARKACPGCTTGMPPLTLPTTPVRLPEVDDGASSVRPPPSLAVGPPTARPHGLEHAGDRVSRPTGRGTPSSSLRVPTRALPHASPPLLDLDGGSDDAAADGRPSTASGNGSDDARQEQRPSVDPGDGLAPFPQPSHAPETDAPRLDAPRQPRAPLGSLLDGTGGVL